MRLSRALFAPNSHEKRVVGPHFSVTYRLLDGHGGCASVISKKVAKRSVDRHLLKRRMSAALRPWCSPTRSIVVYARPGSLALPYQEVCAEIEGLLTRVIG